MEILWVLIVCVLIVAGVIGLGVHLHTRSELKDARRERDNYRTWYHEEIDRATGEYQENARGRKELRQVLAASILANHNNYLAIDPSTFEALPEDFAIFKSADTGSDGDHNILVYQVGPSEVGGVKLQNAIL